MQRLRRKHRIWAVGILALAGPATMLGLRWQHRAHIRAEVLSALRDRDYRSRHAAIEHLRNANRLEAAVIAANMMDDEEPAVRRGAASIIGMLQARDEVADTLARQLRTNRDASVRLGCAINLMMVKTPVARAALLDALHDSSEKVVQIACVEVGDRGGPGATEALKATLTHPSWRVRLEACKALILSRAVDADVTAALEQLAREPEAAVYDSEIEQMDNEARAFGGTEPPGETWGKLHTILEQARVVARNNRR